MEPGDRQQAAPRTREAEGDVPAETADGEGIPDAVEVLAPQIDWPTNEALAEPQRSSRRSSISGWRSYEVQPTTFVHPHLDIRRRSSTSRADQGEGNSKGTSTGGEDGARREINRTGEYA